MRSVITALLMLMHFTEVSLNLITSVLAGGSQAGTDDGKFHIRAIFILLLSLKFSRHTSGTGTNARFGGIWMVRFYRGGSDVLIVDHFNRRVRKVRRECLVCPSGINRNACAL